MIMTSDRLYDSAQIRTHEYQRTENTQVQTGSLLWKLWTAWQTPSQALLLDSMSGHFNIVPCMYSLSELDNYLHVHFHI